MGDFRVLVRGVSDLYDFSDLRRIPFLKGGRDPAFGLDCYGLCMEVSRRVGKELPDFPSPDNVEDIDDVVQRGKEQFEKLENAQAFCLVVFTKHPPFESHIGIVLQDRKTFIHTSKRVNCCIEKLDNPFWQRRLTGFYKWNNTRS